MERAYMNLDEKNNTGFTSNDHGSIYADGEKNERGVGKDKRKCVLGH